VEVKIPRGNNSFIGCYYGPQENQPREEVERQYSQIETQIHKHKKDGRVILGGDFNAKLQINIGNIKQKESRNGEILRRMLNSTEMEPINLRSLTGLWTRENMKNPQEKSTIDYILTCERTTPMVKHIEVDERGSLRMKGHSAESDHNTITATIEMAMEKKEHKVKKWNLNNEEGWKKYNDRMKSITERDIPRTYEGCRDLILKTLKDSVGRKTITIKHCGTKWSQTLKDLKKKRKEKKKEFEKSTTHNKTQRLTEYYRAQEDVRKQIEKEQRQRTRNRLEEMKNSNNPRNVIWEMRKRILRGPKEEYEVIDEDGNKIGDPQTAQEHIANYYEQLYQAREGRETAKEWTEHIKKEEKDKEKETTEAEREPEITLAEMKRAKKKMKKRKAPGPDEIPNEIITQANENTLQVYVNMLNQTVHNKDIPQDWKIGEILSIYKGKGQKGKCSNERGITLSSNLGKTYERIVDERIKKSVKISDYQGGGKKGSSTVDYIMMIKEAITCYKGKYITFLDVTKAYDKAWADALMYILHKQGVQTKLWNITKKMNEGLKATVRTRYGNTREITIKDSIRQGGVLSVTLYATMMDEIAKEITRNNLGVKNIKGKNIGCLLWMDDVALISNTHKEMQEMLNITREIADRYHIEFGEEKSKVMKLGRSKCEEKLMIGEMELRRCKEYKYLGVVINEKNNLADHIEETKRKSEAAFQVMMRLTGNTEFHGIEMESIWQGLETCVGPIITYGIEAGKTTQKERNDLNRILDNIIKRILKVPTTTPRGPLYYETGILDIEHTIKRNKINYAMNLHKKENEILKDTMSADTRKGWTREVKAEMERMSMDITMKYSRETVMKKVKEEMKTKMLKEGEGKSKSEYYIRNTRTEPTIGKRKTYMKSESRHIASNIFIARTRMIEVKRNYKNKFENLNCRFCYQEEETQQHVLEKCTGINRSEFPEITTEEIFKDNGKDYPKTAEKIHKIRKLLANTSAAPPDT